MHEQKEMGRAGAHNSSQAVKLDLGICVEVGAAGKNRGEPAADAESFTVGNHPGEQRPAADHGAVDHALWLNHYEVNHYEVSRRHRRHQRTDGAAAS